MKVDEQTAVIEGAGNKLVHFMPFCHAFEIEPDNSGDKTLQQTKDFKSRMRSEKEKQSGTRSQMSRLQSAVCNNNVEKVIQLVCEENQKVNDSGDIGIQPLAVAAAVGNLEMVQILIDLGSDVNTQDEHDRTALYYAVARLNIKSTHLLLKRGANFSRFVDLLNNSIDTPETRSVVKNLGSMNTTDFLGNTPAILAASKGYNEILTLLLTNEYDVIDTNNNQKISKLCCIDAANKNGESALLISLKHHQTSTAQIILDYGANIHVTDNEENSALHFAALGGFVDIMKTLLQKRQFVNDVNSNGETPLMLAVRGRSYNAVKMLLNHGADVNAINSKGTTSLHELNRFTGSRNVKCIFEALLENGFDIEKHVHLLTKLLADHMPLVFSLRRHNPSLSHTAWPMERQKHQNNSFSSQLNFSEVICLSFFLSYYHLIRYYP